MTSPRGKINKAPFQPFRVAGVIVFLIAALVLWLVFLQYSGDFTDKTKLTMLSDRAGLVMDPGSKVTYNGVQIGRVASIDEIEHDGKPAAKFTLDVYPKYLHLIPANVDARIVATTVFGEKYVSMTAPENPLPQRITPSNVIDARSVTTEINTLFQTITSIAEKVDPVKVNLTLSAAAQALSGLGDKFGQSIINGSAALDEVNPRMPIIRHDIQQLATLGDTYADASPDLFNFLNNGGDDSAHDSRAGKGSGPGVAGGRRIRRHRRRHLQPRRAVPGARGQGPGADGPVAGHLQPGVVLRRPQFARWRTEGCRVRRGANGYSLRSETEIFSGLGLALGLPRARNHGGHDGTLSADRRGRWRAQPLRLPGEPAADQCARRAGRCAGLLADHHP